MAILIKNQIASEPNLKVRSALKAKVIQRRSSPLLRRKDKPSPFKRRTTTNDVATNGIPENSCSPPSGGILSHQSSFGSGGSGSGSTPIQEEPNQSPFNGLAQNSSACDLALYSSPSLPNISLGKPHHLPPLIANTTSVITCSSEAKSTNTAHLNELQLRALRLGIQPNQLLSNTVHSHSAFFPSLSAIEGEFASPTSPNYLQKQLRLLEEQAARNPSNALNSLSAAALSTNPAALYPFSTPISNSVAISNIPLNTSISTATSNAFTSIYGRLPITGACLNGPTPGTYSITAGGPIRPTATAIHAARLIQRPLGRTQSAPLPLGHPALIPNQCVGSSATTAAQSVKMQPTTSSLVKQHIRNAVLTRASSKNQMVENLEEETEAAVAAEAMMNDGGETMESLSSPPLSAISKQIGMKSKEKHRDEIDDEDDDELSNQVIDLTKKRSVSDISDSGLSENQSTQPTKSSLRLTSTMSASNIQQAIQQQQQLIHQQQQQQKQQNSPLLSSVITSNSSANINPLMSYPFIDPSLAAFFQCTAAATNTAYLTAASTFHNSLQLPTNLSAATQLLMNQYNTHLQSNSSSSNFSFNHTNFFQPNLSNHSHHYHHHLQSNINPGRPLSRTLSSPQVMLSNSNKPNTSTSPASPHPEHGGRLQSIWSRMIETGLAARCENHFLRIGIFFSTTVAYPISFSNLLLYLFLADLPIKSLVMLPCGGIGVDSDTTWNEIHTAGAARMAAGCVIELATKVALKEVKNGFAIVRPPGSHAEYQQPMGYCFFNSIAIAAKILKQKLNLKRILIVDWDVHHGNGFQQAFYDDPEVLYISLHRHDEGNFFPGTGDPTETGIGAGQGFNINIGFNGSLNPAMGDAEYVAAFRTVVMPIARQFNPEIVLVACGFDAAIGHPPPLGGYLVTPACFAYMTQQLMTLAGGKIVLALEGGYELTSICDCAQACVSALLGDAIVEISEEEATRKPSLIAANLLNRIIQIQCLSILALEIVNKNSKFYIFKSISIAQYWTNLKRYAHLVNCDAIEAQCKEIEECETVSALASLTMTHVQSPESNSIASNQTIIDDEPMEEDNLENK
ncbi:histone deacetylase 4-like protein [Sarcoptes scabiei]|uniref:histone deacetylase n=1 Tax=Sarcoptes scabiei TaxID=52283 RepID=A0A131ZVJ8_SARSC|nr:histone deacetylase 4-like protein [Sarcoptes scabiei]